MPPRPGTGRLGEPWDPGARRVWVLVALTAALVLGTTLHLPWLNGPDYAPKAWRCIEPLRLFPAMLLGAAPFAAAQWWRARRQSLWPALVLLGLTTFCLQWIAMGMQETPFTPLRAVRIIRHAQLTSYFDEAQRLFASLQQISLRQWFEAYPSLLERMYLHARFRPPGPTLYYAALLANTRYEALAAMLGGVGLSISASVTPAIFFGYLRNLRHGVDEAFAGASLLALLPALLLCFPQFDQLYVLIGCLLVVLWWRALGSERWADAFLFGLVAGLALLMSYIFLLLGAYFAMGALWWASSRRRGVRRALAVAGRSGLFLVGLYVLLWLLTGYSAPAAFFASYRLHAVDVVGLGRPAYPWHLPWDFYEFVVGSGWIMAVLVWWWWRDRWGRISSLHEKVLIGLLQVAIVFVVGRLPGETARLYLFLYPFVLAAAAGVVARLGGRQQAVLYACLWLLGAVLAQNMIFVT